MAILTLLAPAIIIFGCPLKKGHTNHWIMYLTRVLQLKAVTYRYTK